jgi:hypothetical protein
MLMFHGFNGFWLMRMQWLLQNMACKTHVLWLTLSL